MRIRLPIIALAAAMPAMFFSGLMYRYVPFPNGTFIHWTSDLAGRVAVPLVTLYLLYRTGIKPKDYGVFSISDRYRLPELLALCFMCTLAYLSYIVVYEITLDFWDDDQASSDLSEFARHGSRWLAVGYYLVVPAFFEEIFYRGILGLVFLRANNGACAITYVIVSSLFFAIAHSASAWPSFIGYTYLGCVASILYIALRNIWPLIVSHILLNSILLYWWLQ